MAIATAQTLNIAESELTTPIPPALLETCYDTLSPEDIVDADTLQDALRKTAKNHARYAKCYLLQSQLVDLIKGRGL